MSDRHQNDIDQLFRDSLQYGGKMPSPPVWSNIEAELDKDKRRRLILWWIPASIAALLITVASGVWLTQNNLHPGSIRATGRMPSPDAGSHIPMPGSKHRRDVAAAAKTNPRAASANPPTASANSPTASANSRLVFVSPPDPIRYEPAFNSFPLTIQPIVSTTPPAITPKKLKHVAGSHPTPAGLIHPVPLRHPFDLTAYVSQELAGYNFADHDSAGPRGSEIEKQQNTSFSRSVGLLLSYHLDRHWIVESGLSLSRSVTVSNQGKAVAVADNNGKISFLVNTVTGYGYVTAPGNANIGDSAITGKTTGKLNYISVPLTVFRQWKAGRFNLLAGAGATVNRLTCASIQTSVTGATGAAPQTEITQYGLRKLTYGWQVKGECRYRMSQNYAVTFMATFKNSVSPINRNTPYSTYPYNLGIGVGITRTF